MQTLSFPNGHSQKPGHSLATIALVGSLHLILIYAVLAALDVVPAPSIPGVTHFKFIDKTVQPRSHDPPPIQTNLAKPQAGDPVRDPHIQIDGSGDKSTTPIPAGGGSTPTIQDSFEAASGIMATHTIPSYPALDRRLNHEGVVQLALTIDTDGNVSDASVLKSSGYDGLDTAAVAWVKEHWRYKPAMRNGSAMVATARAEVTFKLTQN